MGCCWPSPKSVSGEVDRVDELQSQEHNEQEEPSKALPDSRQKRRRKIIKALRRIMNSVYGDGDVPPEAMGSVFETVRILVVGKSGAGKTTLIRLLLGKYGPQQLGSSDGLPGQQDIQREWRWTTNDRLPLVIHDSNGMDVGGGHINLDTVRRFIDDRQCSSDVSSRIHLIWYVIGANDNRIADEGELMATVATAGVPILLIQTYNDVESLVAQHVTPGVLKNLFRSLPRELSTDILRRMVRIGNAVRIKESTGEIVGDIDYDGLHQVSRATMELLEKHLKYTWIASQVVDLETKLDATVQLILESGKRAFSMFLPVSFRQQQMFPAFTILHDRVCKIWNVPDALRNALSTGMIMQQRRSPSTYTNADSVVAVSRFLAALVAVGTAAASNSYASSSSRERSVGQSTPYTKTRCKDAWRILECGLRLLLTVLYVKSRQRDGVGQRREQMRWSWSTAVDDGTVRDIDLEGLKVDVEWMKRFLGTALAKSPGEGGDVHNVMADLIGDFAVEQYDLFQLRRPNSLFTQLHAMDNDHPEDDTKTKTTPITQLQHNSNNHARYGLHLGYLNDTFFLSYEDVKAMHGDVKQTRNANFRIALEDYPLPCDEYYIEYLKDVSPSYHNLIKDMLC